MKKSILVLSIILVFAFLYPSFYASAEEEQVQALLVISHKAGHDVSAAEVAVDFEAGADMVSVTVERTESGDFILPQSVSSNNRETLEDVIKVVPEGRDLIIDAERGYANEISALVNELGAVNKVFFRTDESTKSLQENGNGLRFISVYSGGIVFSAEKQFRYLKPAWCLQFQSKNYFNPFYQRLFTSHLGGIIITPTYDPNLCGKRTDSVNGWDEMIERGYTAIETANLEGLVDYKEQTSAQRKTLKSLVDEGNDLIRRSGKLYSNASLKVLQTALYRAKSHLGELSSLGSLQNDAAKIRLAIDSLSPAGEKETTLGAWNITSGKIIASVLSGAGLLGIEIFMLRHKRKNDYEQNKA